MLYMSLPTQQPGGPQVSAQLYTQIDMYSERLLRQSPILQRTGQYSRRPMFDNLSTTLWLTSPVYFTILPMYNPGLLGSNNMALSTLNKAF